MHTRENPLVLRPERAGTARRLAARGGQHDAVELTDDATPLAVIGQGRTAQAVLAEPPVQRDDWSHDWSWGEFVIGVIAGACAVGMAWCFGI